MKTERSKLIIVTWKIKLNLWMENIKIWICLHYRNHNGKFSSFCESLRLQKHLFHQIILTFKKQKRSLINYSNVYILFWSEKVASVKKSFWLTITLWKLSKHKSHTENTLDQCFSTFFVLWHLWQAIFGGTPGC